MRSEELAGKRVVLTQADEYMGPAIGELFAAEGADIIRQTGAIASVEQANDLIADAGEFDILVANLALGPQSARIADIDDGDGARIEVGYVVFEVIGPGVTEGEQR